MVLPVKSTGSPKGESNWKDHCVSGLHGVAVFLAAFIWKLSALLGAKAYLLGTVLIAGIADGAIEVQSSLVPMVRSLGGWWVLVAAVLVVICSGLVQRYSNNITVSQFGQPQQPWQPAGPWVPQQGVPAPPVSPQVPMPPFPPMNQNPPSQ